MSFSSDVKRELANIECESCCLKAELYAIIKFKATIKLSFGGLGVSISTTQNAIARRIVYLFKKIYNNIIIFFIIFILIIRNIY